jgi:hypothetical protein
MVEEWKIGHGRMEDWNNGRMAISRLKESSSNCLLSFV